MIINIWLKPSKNLIINCHGLKAVAIQVVDAPGFSQNLIFYEPLRSSLNIFSVPLRDTSAELCITINR